MRETQCRGSSVGIALRYVLDGPGIEFRCWRDLPHSSRPAVGLFSLLYNVYRIILKAKAAEA